MKPRVFVVILNWNEKKLTGKCIKSLNSQSQKVKIVVVDNGSDDDSYQYLKNKFPKIHIIKNPRNLGFSGGANTGLKYCLSQDAYYCALLNNDAVVEKDWIEILYKKLEKNPKLGAVTGKLLKKDGESIDSTGDLYSCWGLPIARQRNNPATDAIQKDEKVFGATAGASMYRAYAIKNAGNFDEKFFAYYEDTDLNFRLQLAGWKILYTPDAVGYHAIGGTSGKLKGFTTYQTTKNLPMLFWKNVPLKLLPKMFPKFFIAYSSIMASSLVKGRGIPALKGFFVLIKNIPHVLIQRRKIQKSRMVSDDYIWSILYKDLPPDAYKLRKLRAFFKR